MSSNMYGYKNMESYVASEWLDALIKEYQEEDEWKMIMSESLIFCEKIARPVKAEQGWPTITMHTQSRQMVWQYCILLDVACKGVPGSACNLMERYLARHVRNFLQQHRNSEEWARYKLALCSRMHRIMVSCVILAGKMSSLQAPLSARSVHYTLSESGIASTIPEIVETECHVFKTLGYRIPLWTTLEMSEFLMRRLGVEDSALFLAADIMINLAEYNRFEIDRHMRRRNLANTPGSSSSSTSVWSNSISIYNLHLSAGAVSASLRYLNYPLSTPSLRLARLIRTCADYIEAISEKILSIAMANPINQIQPEPPNKRRRLL